MRTSLVIDGEEEGYHLLASRFDRIRVRPVTGRTRSMSSSNTSLRQGGLVRRLPWRRWAARRRWPAAAVAAAVLVQFGVVALEHERLGDQNIELRRQIELTYRSVEPSGALTDAEIQLRRKVASLSGSAAGGFLALFEQLGSGLAGAPRTRHRRPRPFRSCGR